MDKALKKRWTKMRKAIKNSGMTKKHIGSKIKVGPNAISLYTQTTEDGEPCNPNYVTEGVTAKLEVFFEKGPVNV